METKDLIAMALIPMGIFGGVVAACVSQRARDAFFFLLVLLSVVTERMDVNFVSRDWYRGTTRGFEFSVVDVLAISVLVGSILFPRPGRTRAYWPASLGLMILFLLYACLSVAIADPKLFGLFELSKMARGLVVFLAAAMFVRSERELRILVIALALAVCWQGLFAFLQRYGYGVHRVMGTLGDSNSLSVYLCLTAPVFVAAVTSRFPKGIKYLCVLALALACLAVILTISRAGVVTMGMVLLGATAACVSFRITLQKVLVAMLVVVGVCGALYKARNTLKSRFEESNLKQEYGASRGQGRGYYIRIAITIAEENWFGVGLNNWSYWVSNRYGPKLGWKFVPYFDTSKPPSDIVPPGRNVDMAQAAPAHSLGALTLGELGLPGLLLFALLWLRWFQMGVSFLWRRSPEPMRRMGVGFFFALCGLFLQSLTEWVYRQTAVFFTFNILLGALASLYYSKRLARRQQREAAAREAEEFPFHEPNAVIA